MFLLFIEYIVCVFKKFWKMLYLSNLLILVFYVVLIRGMLGWLLNIIISIFSFIVIIIIFISELRILMKIFEVLF